MIALVPGEVYTHDLLSLVVSHQATAWSNIDRELSIHEVLNDIRDGKYASQIEQLQGLLAKGNTEGYSAHKKRLPAVTFCGTFDQARRLNTLKSYNNIVVLDIDKLDETAMKHVHAALTADPYVFALWMSPSRNGFKGLVRLQFESLEPTQELLPAWHRAAFVQLQRHFELSHGIALDQSGSDITRLCFVSHDPEITLKPTCLPFCVELSEEERRPTAKVNRSAMSLAQKFAERDLLFNPKERNKPTDRRTMNTILRFLEKRDLSITRTYDDWYRVSYAIATSFTHDIGEKYFLRLCSLDKDKYDEQNCKNFLQYAYGRTNRSITFSTVVYLAGRHGYQPEQKRVESSEGGQPQVSASKTGDNQMP